MSDKIKSEYTRLKSEVDTIILKPAKLNHKYIFIIKILIPLILGLVIPFIIKPNWLYKDTKDKKTINYHKYSIFSILIIISSYLIIFHNIVIKKIKKLNN